MRLGFDAKRALNNFTGLGNHARILLNAMMRDYPGNEYLLYSPKAKTELFNELHGEFELALPEQSFRHSIKANQSFGGNTAIAQSFNLLKKGGLWRSWGITSDLARDRIDLYHGLSNELPFNIHRTNIKTVVTIHDLIFLKHTEQYPYIDRQFYILKTKYAAQHAHKIIAVSEETKADLIHFYKVPAEKIEVIYQSVDPAFQNDSFCDPAELTQYQLPSKFIMTVGSFFPRKNHKLLIQAFDLIKDKIEESLLLVGSDGSAKKEIEAFISDRRLGNRVRIISGVSNKHMPAVYRLANLFVYPSLYEGFGIPALEALFSKVPVIASNVSAIQEAGGKHSIFIDPHNANELADAMLKVLTNGSLKKQMTEAGYEYAQTLTDKIFAQKIMRLYKEVAGK